MENLNAEQVKNEIQSLIKALKDCGGWVERGNGEGWFNHEILADALAIINLQEQRIKELTEENERLREACDRSDLLCKVTGEISKTTRNEVIDEFAEMVKEKMREVAQGKRTSLIGSRWIDEIAKEMLEGEK